MLLPKLFINYGNSYRLLFLLDVGIEIFNSLKMCPRVIDHQIFHCIRYLESLLCWVIYLQSHHSIRVERQSHVQSLFQFFYQWWFRILVNLLTPLA